jgi:hypothetical protein
MSYTKRGKLTRSELVRLQSEGLTVSEIAGRVGLSSTRVRTAMTRLGLIVDGRGKKRPQNQPVRMSRKQRLEYLASIPQLPDGVKTAFEDGDDLPPDLEAISTAAIESAKSVLRARYEARGEEGAYPSHRSQGDRR